METLSITSFAGLQKADFELRPVTVLIGPQATGKSVVAKLLYFLRGLPMAMIDAAQAGLSWTEFVAKQEARFARFFPPVTWGPDGFEIRHQRNRRDVVVRRREKTEEADEDKGEIHFGGPYRQLYKEIVAGFKKLPSADKQTDEVAVSAKAEALVRAASEKNLQRSLGEPAGYLQIFITATRAFFSQTKATVFTQLSEGESLDPFVIEFGKFLEQTRRTLALWGFWTGKALSERLETPKVKEDRKQLHACLKLVLGGSLSRNRSGEIVKTEDGRTIPIGLGSSGQQEALPLLLPLARFFLVPNAKGRSVYIEEPEAHLFPSAQREVVELLVETFTRRAGKMEMVVTTHSPYVLTALNNLLKAGQRYAEGELGMAAKLEKIVPKNRALAPDALAAYVLGNSTAKSIIDPETGLIDGTAIDQASELMAEEFHQLLWKVR